MLLQSSSDEGIITPQPCYRAFCRFHTRHRVSYSLPLPTNPFCCLLGKARCRPRVDARRIPFLIKAKRLFLLYMLISIMQGLSHLPPPVIYSLSLSLASNQWLFVPFRVYSSAFPLAYFGLMSTSAASSWRSKGPSFLNHQPLQPQRGWALHTPRLTEKSSGPYCFVTSIKPNPFLASNGSSGVLFQGFCFTAPGRPLV